MRWPRFLRWLKRVPVPADAPPGTQLVHRAIDAGRIRADTILDLGLTTLSPGEYVEMHVELQRRGWITDLMLEGEGLEAVHLTTWGVSDRVETYASFPVFRLTVEERAGWEELFGSGYHAARPGDIARLGMRNAVEATSHATISGVMIFARAPFSDEAVEVAPELGPKPQLTLIKGGKS